MSGSRNSTSKAVFIMPLCLGLACLVVMVWGQCGPPPQRPNTVLTGEGRPDYVEGAVVRYSCQVGFTKTKAGAASITCKNKAWSESTLVCVPKSCGSPGEILNGQYVYPGEGVTFGQKVTAVCDKGYQLSGSGVRNCRDNGWDGSIPQCEPVKCPDPPEIQNGHIKYLPGRTVTYSTVITYECSAGYYLEGDRDSVCTEDGTFNSDPPRCKEVKDCQNPLVKNGRKVAGFGHSYKHNQDVSFACDQGHRLDGSSSVTCQGNGTWLPPVPKCLPIDSKSELNPGGRADSLGTASVLLGLVTSVTLMLLS
ncbi:membrane cofactor protein-like [Acipenser oxyrinchus oxyrinchus]|uniref:Membrane cofactor protein-like n=1 Tax=Acipenser oxyrinchus oxyrinchus TaxID=40147 RepID=A0AAD8CQV8_ACIOX|nr:membrane cofactor protein-like [Acipenser oxyrinchus oxyrinchus]